MQILYLLTLWTDSDENFVSVARMHVSPRSGCPHIHFSGHVWLNCTHDAYVLPLLLHRHLFILASYIECCLYVCKCTVWTFGVRARRGMRISRHVTEHYSCSFQGE